MQKVFSFIKEVIKFILRYTVLLVLQILILILFLIVFGIKYFFSDDTDFVEKQAKELAFKICYFFD